MTAARRVASLSLALALGALATQGLAYTPSASRWNPASLPIPYRVNANSAPSTLGPDTARSIVDAGFATWAAPTCTRWRSTNAGSTSATAATAGDRENSILWISSSWPAELGDVRSTIGVTTPVWRSGSYFIDADIQFNAVGFRWSTTGASGTVDTQSIATHEEGHFLGLDHTSIRGAVMYPSYSGGQLRNLSSDDIAGVCALYPSGGPVPDAGVPPVTDPCARYTSCGGCTPVDGCGWCGATNSCRQSTSSGPVSGTCASGFAWLPTECSGTPPVDSGLPPPVDSGTTDPCGRYTTCATCTPIDGCGWCGATNSCRQSTETGPVSGTCASAFAWLPAQCPGSTPTGGTAAFGEPCTAPADCSTGGLCVSDGRTSFCSRRCTDDCTCPRGYRCVATRTAGLSVCAAGTNTCSTGTDSGTPVTDTGFPVPTDTGFPRTDTGTPTPTDTGTFVPTDTGTAPGTDVPTSPDASTTDSTTTTEQPLLGSSSGCGCRTEGSSSDRAGGLLGLGLALAALRRRRR